jgi:alpha-galactosidase
MKNTHKYCSVNLLTGLIAVAGSFFLGMQAWAATPTPSEMNLAEKWAEARLAGNVDVQPPKAGLQVFANNDPVQKRSRNGGPMNISGNLYKKGLYCHAVSDVLVTLPGKAKTLFSEIGVDTNGDTSGGRGSVEFIVAIGDKELFHSDLIREGRKPQAIKVDLNGVSEFSLKISDGGDGIACDQSDWADIRVEMEDGSILWLDELPILNEGKLPLSTDPLFSFTYDGKSSKDLLSNWKFDRKAKKFADKTAYDLTWNDSQTGLEVRCEAIKYANFPTIEWTVYFKNNGKEKTPILENIQALDALFSIEGTVDPILHHQTGAPSRQDDYKPMQTVLQQNKTVRFVAAGGRGTDEQYPYYNVEYPGNGGLIVVVGWPGQWAADFTKVTVTHGKALQIHAGQELTHLYLNPGEEIRTPLMAVQFYEGDRYHSQNVWRSWMLVHNVRQIDGKPAPLHWAACSSHQYHEMINATTDTQIHFIDRYLDEKIGLNYWWMDAGWYVNNGDWPNTGTWEIDQKRFPGGFKPISDHGHAKGVKTLVWFEPERVNPGTWLYDHPAWLLSNKNPNGDKLLDMGNKEAWNWLVNHIDNLLTENGIDLYRQDYNIAPLSYWRNTDTPDRQGITENHYICGYLAYWDELIKRHPNMLIDSCASGGRRNDLETMRRSFPLLRSDYIFEPIGQQGHTYGIAFWIPLFGTGQRATDDYGFRSCMTPFINTCWDMRPEDVNYDANRKDYQTWAQVKECFYGDYYPLTPYSLDASMWIAWQFNCPDTGKGMIEAFCREDSIYESARLRLNDLDSSAQYLVKDIDGGFKKEISGSELMNKGLLLQTEKRPNAFIVTYEKTK